MSSEGCGKVNTKFVDSTVNVCLLVTTVTESVQSNLNTTLHIIAHN
jgi:hypothetical protein